MFRPTKIKTPSYRRARQLSANLQKRGKLVTRNGKTLEITSDNTIGHSLTKLNTQIKKQGLSRIFKEQRAALVQASQYRSTLALDMVKDKHQVYVDLVVLILGRIFKYWQL